MIPRPPSQQIDFESIYLEGTYHRKSMREWTELVARLVEESTIQRCKKAVSEEEDLNQLPRLYARKAGEVYQCCGKPDGTVHSFDCGGGLGGGKVNGKTCGTHPGMSCSEAHLDDSMKIAALNRQLESLSDSKTGVPCKGGVTVNVGYLRERIAKLETELTAEQTLRVNKYANAERLIEWMDDPNRKPANTSFTEGPERQIAYRFERKR